MKKFLGIFIGLMMVILVSGCSSEKTMTCTKETVDGENYKTVDTFEITYNSKKVLKVKNTIVTDSGVEYADFSLGVMMLFKSAFDGVDGVTINVEKVGEDKIKTETEILYDQINIDNMKSQLGELIDEDSYYTSSNVTIKEFKEAHLEGYTCK